MTSVVDELKTPLQKDLSWTECCSMLCSCSYLKTCSLTLCVRRDGDCRHLNSWVGKKKTYNLLLYCPLLTRNKKSSLGSSHIHNVEVRSDYLLNVTDTILSTFVRVLLKCNYLSPCSIFKKNVKSRKSTKDTEEP